MTWPDFFLICFLVGFLLSMVSLITGHLHLNSHHHGGLHFDHGHIGHAGPHAGGGHAGAGHAGGPHAPAGHAPGQTAGAHDTGSEVPWFNFGTLSAFLAWFGGAGYLATHFYHAMLLTAFGISFASGLVGASVVFFFLAKVLMGRPEHLDPADFEMIGVLGTVSGPIRTGGTGEILYVQQGARKAVGARSEDGIAIPKGIEVVVTRYENGIAYVRRWDELTAPGMELTKEQ
jgi:membrane protein implicated in regulation of membrane protease activity